MEKEKSNFCSALDKQFFKQDETTQMGFLTFLGLRNCGFLFLPAMEYPWLDGYHAAHLARSFL